MKAYLLILDRVRELGQEVLNLHEELQKWHKDPIPDIEKTMVSLRLQNKLTEQRAWLDALEELFDETEQCK